MSVLGVIGTLTKIVRFREVSSRNKSLGSPTNHVPIRTLLELTGLDII